ncbi:hypothetical protein CSB45_07450 [candidate division KSB3 bacterium]|uniref:YdhG-like domain-containing protein n=1 Tax=candidate division KSB3 bacterium TaxID=2044937 RepID=A0A2G6E6G8_9BACT|nr:MAG: hypothetical protein CSB45_07450 [candidate division KSB3 bacterium]PIE29870.1 MAG: hypothetical protein CSA57_06155 [candidate division KSB3 bacterium]
MKASDPQKVQDLLSDIEVIDPEKYDILMKLRDLVFTHHPDTKENVKYGGIMFSLSDDFGGIFVRKKHVSFEFTAGNELNDPDKFLEGTGKYRRHLKLYSQEDIDSKKLAYYLQQIK